MLDDDRVAGGQEKRRKVGMLLELCGNGFAHDIDLDRFPVSAKWRPAIAAETRSLRRLRGSADLLSELRVQELLRLKIVL